MKFGADYEDTEQMRKDCWMGFLLVGSAAALFALFQRPRSVAEFQAVLFQIDGLYLMLITIGSLIAASVIALVGRQET